MRYLMILCLLTVFSIGTMGCTRNEAERTADEAGDMVRDAAHETKDMVHDAADSVKDATN